MASRRRFTPPTLPPDMRNETIGRLREEVYFARQALLHALPEPQGAILKWAERCDSMEELFAWSYWATDQLIDIAAALTPSLDAIESPRARCPLCGRGAQTSYVEGFSVPEGMRRHLLGTHKGVRCNFMRVVFNGCRERIWEDADHRATGLVWSRPEEHPTLPWQVAERPVEVAEALPRT